MKTQNKQTYREIIILFCVVLLALFFIIASSRLLFGKRSDIITEEISVRIEDLPYEYLLDTTAGERVLDRSRRTILGTIKDISTTPHMYERAQNGESILVEKKGYCDATFRIQIERENRRNLDTGVFYIGASITISTRSFAGDGRIVSISHEGEGK